MRKAEIKIGERYNAQGRCVEVTSDPEPHPYKERRYRWRVRYPLEEEAKGKDEITGLLDSDDFARLWNDDDQRRWDERMAREAEQEAAQNLLHEAGYPSATVSVMHGDRAVFRLSKEDFDKLVEVLSVAKHNAELEEAAAQ